MKRYGERFLMATDFISHCRELNIRVSKEELEHYEKTGVMLPVVRLTCPEEYVVEQAQLRLSHSFDIVDTSRWPELQRLEERLLLIRFPEDFACLTDAELVHCFDREFDANPYLARPSTDTFMPWNEYRVQLPDVYDGQLTEPTAEHYYSYWQVHQLHHIRKFPILYKYRRLLEHVPEGTQSGLSLHSLDSEYLADFKGMRRYFDALSFWMIVYLRERGRTFAAVTEVNGVRTLSESQTDDLRERLKTHAGVVLSRFNFCSDDLYEFLRELIGLYEAYLQDERYKLAEDLKSDMLHLSNLIELKAGVSRERIEDSLSYYDARTFRHLNEANKERDYAVNVMKNVASKCTQDLHALGINWSFTESEINDLLDHCEQEGVGLLCTALSGMLAIGDEEHRLKYRRVTRYTNIKNILSSYEYLLKSLGDKANPNLDIGGKPLTSAVDTAMANESWFALSLSQRNGPNGSLLKADNTTDFINNLTTILNDSQLSNSVEGYWARTFLFVLSARNVTVHFYPDEDSYYGELFGEMLNTSVIAMFYTWRWAKQKGWV